MFEDFSTFEEWRPEKPEPADPKDYRIAKPISAEILARTNICEGELGLYFKEFGNIHFIYDIFPIIEFCNKKSGRLEWGITNGFLEKVKKEKFYRVGQRFKYDGVEYLMASIYPSHINNAICGFMVVGGSEDVGFFSSLTMKISVGEVDKITEAEFKQMCNGYDFKEVE